MQRAARLTILLALLAGAAGCVRRDGRNSDCKWPAEAAYHAATPRHLSADAEFAEDLAIRYADVHYGLHTPGFISEEAYGAARDGCMQTLFQDIGRGHGVAVAEVSRALGHNRGYLDLAEILPFALLYCLGAAAVARMNWRRNSPAEQGWAAGMIMAVFLSLALAVGGTMLGEVWCGIVETLRIGNNHMSYRLERLLWARHRPEAFVVALVVFWAAAVQAARQHAGARAARL